MVTTTTPLTPEEIARHAAVLATSSDRGSLAASARTLASSGQPEAIDLLGRFLQDQIFLARLDAVEEPQQKLTNLRHVLAALQAHPNQSTGRLCEMLAESPGFLTEPDRKIFLLPALAAVRPMSEKAEAIFRKANAEGYWNSDGPMLMGNGSPRALSLFAEMVADGSVAEADRIDMIHWAVPAHRLHAGVADMVRGLLDRGLPPEVERALVETLFDYQGDEWFGRARNPPVPPPWPAAETGVLQRHLKLGEHILQTRKPPPPLAKTIESTLHEIRAILAARPK
jgi:hypothetical protein